MISAREGSCGLPGQSEGWACLQVPKEPFWHCYIEENRELCARVEALRLGEEGYTLLSRWKILAAGMHFYLCSVICKNGLIWIMHAVSALYALSICDLKEAQYHSKNTLLSLKQAVINLICLPFIILGGIVLPDRAYNSMRQSEFIIFDEISLSRGEGGHDTPSEICALREQLDRLEIEHERAVARLREQNQLEKEALIYELEMVFQHAHNQEYRDIEKPSSSKLDNEEMTDLVPELEGNLSHDLPADLLIDEREAARANHKVGRSSAHQSENRDRGMMTIDALERAIQEVNEISSRAWQKGENDVRSFTQSLISFVQV